MVTPRFLPETGGVETHVYQVSRRLVARGESVMILTSDRSRRLPANEIIDGIQVKRVPAWPRHSDFYFAPEIYSDVQHTDFDILHIQSYHTFVPPIAMIAARRVQKPYVLTFHGGGHSSRLRHAARTFQRFLLRPLLVRASKLIAIAHFEIDLFSKELNLPREKFVLIPNGAELLRPKAETISSSRDEALIVSVGRLEKYKGFHRLIRALPYVLKQKPDARLSIFGEGPYYEALCVLVKQLRLEKKVSIRSIPPTEREALARELLHAGLFILFSEYETHPLAALEAISLGCSAMVAETSGLSELAQQGLANTVPLNCPDEQLAEAIIAQLNRPLTPKAIQLPSWDDCAKDLLALYRNVARS
jgi:glycosyltransferase involved in cell wall biosynthesis